MKGTVALVSSGSEKKDSEVANMFSISGSEIPWSTRPKKPSVSAAWMSWAVISSMREEKS